MTEITQAIEQITNIANAINTIYFDNALPPITFEIATIKANTIKLLCVNNIETWQVTLTHNTINKPIEYLTAELIHLCIHIWCKEHSIKDTSRNDAYHNKTFKQYALSKDLDVQYSAKTGWSKTTPNEKLTNIIQNNHWKTIKIEQSNSHKTTQPRQQYKYQCPKCGCSVRGTKSCLNIKCMDCDQQMHIVNLPKNNPTGKLTITLYDIDN